MERGVRRREDKRLLERPLDSALGVEAATARLSLPCRADGTTADRPHQEEPAQLSGDHGLSTASDTACQWGGGWPLSPNWMLAECRACLLLCWTGPLLAGCHTRAVPQCCRLAEQ